MLRSLGIPVQRVVLSDRPDAVITDFCGRRVGVEVMECRPSSIVSKGRNSKAQARNLVDFACRQYEKILAERGYEHIRAHINFKDKAYRVDRSINRLQFVDSILDEIERHRRNDRYERRRRQLSRKDFIAMKLSGAFHYEYVSSVRFADCYPHSTLISPVYCYWVGCVRDEHILHCVKQKDAKLEEYRRLPENGDISEYWLVLNIPIEEECDFEHYRPSCEIETAYDRIYLTRREELLRIK
ncbi:MAG: hypothetical protein K2J51_09415 [Alistipes sp.]|nr:hypothetical protein [Alistipes sp.]